MTVTYLGSLDEEHHDTRLTVRVTA